MPLPLPLPPSPLAQLVFLCMEHHVFRCLPKNEFACKGRSSPRAETATRLTRSRGIRMRHQSARNTCGTPSCCNIGMVGSCGSLDTSGFVLRAEAIALRGASQPSGVFSPAKHGPSGHRLCPIARRLQARGQPPPFSEWPPPSSPAGRRKDPHENQAPRPKQPLAPMP